MSRKPCLFTCMSGSALAQTSPSSGSSYAEKPTPNPPSPPFMRWSLEQLANQSPQQSPRLRHRKSHWQEKLGSPEPQRPEAPQPLPIRSSSNVGRSMPRPPSSGLPRMSSDLVSADSASPMAACPARVPKYEPMLPASTATTPMHSKETPVSFLHVPAVPRCALESQSMLSAFQAFGAKNRESSSSLLITLRLSRASCHV
mmetsp:Transcript_58161/g.162145  ORF Transcript_58161/g.162145 Transcript_58161/m.162145 type:complete len:200 (+) Transcript_58161:450-1049(+)